MGIMNERVFDSATGDIVFDGRGFSRVDSVKESVLQVVRSYVSTFQGECFTDRNAGVPWFDKVLGIGTAFVDMATQIVKEKIMEVPGVKRVAKATIDIDGRNIGGTFYIVLDDGTTEKIEV